MVISWLSRRRNRKRVRVYDFVSSSLHLTFVAKAPVANENGYADGDSVKFKGANGILGKHWPALPNPGHPNRFKNRERGAKRDAPFDALVITKMPHIYQTCVFGISSTLTTWYLYLFRSIQVPRTSKHLCSPWIWICDTLPWPHHKAGSVTL